jgi:uncharacterized protein (DUF1810 family)
VTDFDLERFVAAQDRVWVEVQRELRAGEKRSHWIWYVFPQVAGLGMSGMSRAYAISGREEAVAYLAHPVLGQRLLDCIRLVLGVEGKTAVEIFGAVDAVKFRSCLTLFGQVSAAPEFVEALARYYGGEADEATLARL